MKDWLKEHSFALIIVFTVAAMIGVWRVTYLDAKMIEAEVAKTKAEQGHKFKFGITRESNSITRDK